MKAIRNKLGSMKNAITRSGTGKNNAPNPARPSAPPRRIVPSRGPMTAIGGRPVSDFSKMEKLPSQQDFQNFVRRQDDELRRLYAEITDEQNIRAMATGVQGAQQNDSARKSHVQQITRELNEYFQRLTNIVDTIERERQSITTVVNEEKRQLAEIEAKMKNKAELADLRKEQASDVRQKFGANFHSSFLGLWKPLHPNTRGVLYTVSTVLMLVAVASVGYLVISNRSQISPAKTTTVNTKGSGVPANSLFNETDNYGRVAGGALKLRSKK